MDTAFNLYGILLLLGVVQCVVASAILAVRSAKASGAPDGWLSAVLAATALEIAPYLIGFMGGYDRAAWLSNFPIGSPLLLGPLALGYVATVSRAATHRRVVWALVGLAGADVLMRLIVWAQTMWGTPYAQTWGPLLGGVVGEVGLIVAAGCIVAALRLALRFRRIVVADERQRRVAQWLMRFASAATVGLVVVAGFRVAYVLGVSFSYERQWWVTFTYAVLGYYVSVAGLLFSFRRSSGAQAKTADTPPPLSADGVRAWTPRLDRWMRTERAYLRSDLTVAALARDVGLPVAALSHVVNEGFGCRFTDFVNGYRVEAVQARLLLPDASTHTLLGIAMDCGFNSKATFNRAFRKATGTTPSAWWAAQSDETGRNTPVDTSQTAW